MVDGERAATITKTTRCQLGLILDCDCCMSHQLRLPCQRVNKNPVSRLLFFGRLVSGRGWMRQDVGYAHPFRPADRCDHHFPRVWPIVYDSPTRGQQVRRSGDKPFTCLLGSLFPSAVGLACVAVCPRAHHFPFVSEADGCLSTKVARIPSACRIFPAPANPHLELAWITFEIYDS